MRANRLTSVETKPNNLLIRATINYDACNRYIVSSATRRSLTARYCFTTITLLKNYKQAFIGEIADELGTVQLPGDSTVIVIQSNKEDKN